MLPDDLLRRLDDIGLLRFDPTASPFQTVREAADVIRRMDAENVRLAAQVAAYEAQWGALYARRSSGL